MEKERLSDYLSHLTITKFGSFSALAREIEIPYEKFRKCFQRNSFSLEELHLIADALGIPPIKIGDFEMKLKRQYKSREYIAHTTQPEISLSRLVPKQYIEFVIHNKTVRERLCYLIARECERIHRVLTEGFTE